MDNMITMEQWKILETSVELSARKEREPNDVIYKAQRTRNNRTRHLIYDNYDRYFSPGLNFIVNEGEDTGRLIVYSSSEQNYAPINFKKGLEIAENFFSHVGTEMSEEIVGKFLSTSPQFCELWS